MSYILDALKKAEADRDPESRASLAIAEHDRHRNRLLAYGMVAALIINAMVLLWLFFPTQWLEQVSAPGGTGEPDSVPLESPIVRQAEQPEAPPRAPPISAPPRPAVSGPVAATRPPPTSVVDQDRELTIGPDPVESPARSPANRPATEPSTLASLPSDVQRRFPDLEFSTHIYADESDLRAVVVNGMRLEEGDRLDNLRVAEITEDGAVFEFEDRLVSVSVLDAWN